VSIGHCDEYRERPGTASSIPPVDGGIVLVSVRCSTRGFWGQSHKSVIS